jgi:hypothetical protein
MRVGARGEESRLHRGYSLDAHGEIAEGLETQERFNWASCDTQFTSDCARTSRAIRCGASNLRRLSL